MCNRLGSNCMAAAFKHDPSRVKWLLEACLDPFLFSTQCFLSVVTVVMGEGLDRGSVLPKE